MCNSDTEFAIACATKSEHQKKLQNIKPAVYLHYNTTQCPYEYLQALSIAILGIASKATHIRTGAERLSNYQKSKLDFQQYTTCKRGNHSSSHKLTITSSK